MWGRIPWTRAEEEQAFSFHFPVFSSPLWNRRVSLRGSLFHFPLLEMIFLITTSNEKFLEYTFPKQTLRLLRSAYILKRG